MSESSTPPGPMSTTSRDESPTNKKMARSRNRDRDQNHHRKQRLLQKEKLVQEKNVVPLVKRKALDEKRHRESYNNPLFICNICCTQSPNKTEIFLYLSRNSKINLLPLPHITAHVAR